MIAAIIVAILLAIVVVFLLVKLNQRTREKEDIEKRERRTWMLKVALEQSCRLPAVEAPNDAQRSGGAIQLPHAPPCAAACRGMRPRKAAHGWRCFRRTRGQKSGQHSGRGTGLGEVVP